MIFDSGCVNIKVEDRKLSQEQLRDINLGEMAERFLQSPEWIDLVKPVIDSMLLGVKDVTSIKITSEKQAQAEIIGRKITADYLSEIQTLLQAHIDMRNSIINSINKRPESSFQRQIEQ